MYTSVNKSNTIEEILSLIPDGADLILPIGNGEANQILTALDLNASRYQGIRIHQMLELRDRGYIRGECPKHIQYISYFLGGYSRKAYTAGQCELVPNHFHEAPRILAEQTSKPIVISMASPMDENGYFSLGTQADYVSPFIGKVPFILEVNDKMPRSYGDNQIHWTQVLGYFETDYPLYELIPPQLTENDHKIASYVVDRIEDGDTLQIGIGGIPNAIMGFLENHQELGLHTEMLTDGVVRLVNRGVITGNRKKRHQGKIICTFALGTNGLYQFMHENKDVEFYRVDYVNDPRNIALEDHMVSINSTTEVSLIGECASETIEGRYYSSTGGQADFTRGVRLAEKGKGFICLYSTAKGGTISRIRPQLSVGSIVTTSKNDVDCVVTEYGIAELAGKSVSKRAEALIQIAHPKFRDQLNYEAQQLGILSKNYY